ncbi:hypothetical protein [Mycobacterium sp. NPDC004974]
MCEVRCGCGDGPCPCGNVRRVIKGVDESLSGTGWGGAVVDVVIGDG